MDDEGSMVWVSWFVGTSRYLGAKQAFLGTVQAARANNVRLPNAQVALHAAVGIEQEVSLPSPNARSPQTQGRHNGHKAPYSTKSDLGEACAVWYPQSC